MKTFYFFFSIIIIFSGCTLNNSKKGISPKGDAIQIYLNKKADRIYNERLKKHFDSSFIKPNQNSYWELGDNIEGFGSYNELIALNDSILYFLFNDKMFEVSISHVDEIQVLGYDESRLGITTSMLACVVIDLGIGVGLASLANHTSANSDWIIPAYISFGIIPLTIWSFLSGYPEVDFEKPFYKSKLNKLKAFARYPQGITTEQLQYLLWSYKQKECYKVVH